MSYPRLHTLSAPLLLIAVAACGGDLPVGENDSDSSSGAPGSTSSAATTAEPTGTTAVPTTGDTTGPSDTTGPIVDSTGPDPASTGTTEATSESTSTTTTDGTTEPETSGSTGEPVDGWQPPACDMVTGTGAVTFSFDQGATFAPMDQQIFPVHYTFGLVALGKPGAMLAGSKMEILASSDAGCSWHSIGAAAGPNAPALVLRAAGDTRAYGFGDNDSALIRVDDEQITKLSSPAGQEGIVGLGVDPADPDHVRIGDSAGRLWDSVDAGMSWQPLGQPAFVGSLAYRAAFDPQDIDHALIGALGEGVLTTHSAGAQWHKATGLGPGKANGFNVAVAPADGEVVWVEGLDLEDPDDQTKRHVYRSEDGGLTFAAVVDADEATLYNGNHLFPHPTDPDVLYFVFGSNYANYGTDLYRYDVATDSLTQTHNPWHDTVITFLPSDPSVIYMGLSKEPGGG